MATPASNRVAPSAVIDTGTSPKLPNCAETLPAQAKNSQANAADKRHLLMRFREAILESCAGKRKTPAPLSLAKQNHVPVREDPRIVDIGVTDVKSREALPEI